MTKKQAYEKVARLTLKMLSRFCPLIKDLCRSDCICFMRPYYDCYATRIEADTIASIENKDVWYVEDGKCAAYMSTGPEKGGDE